MESIKRRQEKLCALLCTEGYDRAVIGDPLSMYYFTDVHINPYERFHGLIIDPNTQTLKMVLPNISAGSMKGRIQEIIYFDEVGPQAAIDEALGDATNIAVEEKYFSMAFGRHFSKTERYISDIGSLVSSLRQRKDEQEIEYMKIAVSYVDDAIAHIKKLVKPGMTERELYKLLYNHMSVRPGFIEDEIIIYVQGGENSSDPHNESGDYQFQYGDIILMDFCARYEYYWSDITRCIFLGEVKNKTLLEIYDIVLNANLTAIDHVKPGVKAMDIDKAARDYIVKAGYGEQFIHRTGHGLGLDIHEEPYMTGSNDLILEPGMTFTIEPGIYIPGVGGVRIEDDILVTEDGHEILTKTSKRLKDNIISV